MRASFLAAAVLLAIGMGVPAMADDVTIEREGLSAPLAGSFMGERGTGRAGVVVIPGSGPTDRDGNNPLGVKAATYRLLVEALADEGVASLRIDKRGMFASAGAVADPNAVTIADYAGDAQGWAAKLREETGAPCAWLLGHSEGALVALSAASADPAGLCGVILVAAPGRRMGEILTEQLAANPGAAPLLDEVRRHIAALEAGEAITGPVHPGLAPLFGPRIRGFMASLLAQDPAAMVAAIDLPVLILHGREDIQVADADAEALAAAQPEARLVMLEGVNHVLKSVPPGDRAANMASYGDPELPLAGGVAAAIAGFISENRQEQ